MAKDLLIVALVSIVAVVGLVILAQGGASGMLNLCPEGSISMLKGIPGGGQQVICVAQPSHIGEAFETYEAHPAGDYRRQVIATEGYGGLNVPGRV